MKLRLVLFALTLVLGLQTTFANTAPAVQNGIEPVMADEYTNHSSVDASDMKVIKKEKKGLGNIITWIKEKVNKVVKKFAQLGGLSDPVDKWFWYWLMGWGAGLLLSIISVAAVTGSIYGGGFTIWWILGILSYLAWLFGTVALIVWLIKKFA